MISPEKHYLILQYLRNPTIDLGGGESVSPIALKAKEQHLVCVREKSLGAVCIDVPYDAEKLLLLWDMLYDHAHLVSAKPFPEDIYREFKKKARFQVIESAPFIVLRKLNGPAGEVPFAKKRPTPGQKTICMVRYGAYGDHIQMSPVIDHFHNEGWWVVYNTNRRGMEVYRGDPRIDDYIYHEDNVVEPTEKEMLKYYDSWKPHFDKYICFAEVVEKTLLRIEGTPEYNEPWAKRHAECNRNYYDEHFVRAGLPEIKGRPPVIWLSEKEKEWAKTEVELARKKTGKSFIVLWNIMGSSFHKMYPWASDVWLLCQHNGDDIGFITVSDALGSYLEDSRFANVMRRAGKYRMRHTMALHSAVDAVVTPETNSMNIGLAFPAPVIAFLSHSGREQFPWRGQDISMAASAKDCPCTPCHQLHYSRFGCPQGPMGSGATLCAESIAPGDVYQNLLKLYQRHQQAQAVGTIQEVAG